MTATDVRGDLLDLEEGLNARRVAKLADIPPQSEPWLRTRKLGIGGSDAAAVCGLGEWQSAFEVYLDKTQQHPDGLTIPDNDYMRWGRILEDPVAEETELRTGCTHVKPTWLFQHREHDWMLANPDRLVIDPIRSDVGVYEGKTCSYFVGEKWGEDEGDSPAMYALFQAVHYMTVLDLRWADIAVLIAGQDYRHYRIERDDELVAMLVAYEADFWDRVQRKDPPDPTGSAGDKDLLTRMFECVADKELLVGDDVVEQARQYNQFRAIEKQASEEKERIGNTLRFLMGDAAVAKDAGGKTIFTWKEANTTQFQQKRFEQTMPRFSQFFKDKTKQRRLDVKKKI